MVNLKNEAAKDVATFSSVESFSKSLPKTKAVLNQVVADLYTAHIALHQVHCTCVELVLWFGILRWMSTWKPWIRLWMK